MIKRDRKGRFMKGSSNAWNKGLSKKTDSRVKKISESNKGKNLGFKEGNRFWEHKKAKETQFKKGRESKYKNIARTKEVREKISQTILNNPKLRNEMSGRMKENRKKIIFPLKDTKIEVKIQNFLKQLGIEYFTHQYMKIKHGYQCDILVPSMNMIIECDGDYWHKYPMGRDIDKIRTSELLGEGFKVLRLWEHEIKEMDIREFKRILPIRSTLFNKLPNIVRGAL